MCEIEPDMPAAAIKGRGVIVFANRVAEVL
ncbi:hypothetical protein HD593_006966 [Nonomuraea rubra]|uniref:Uncharacterized protein n=1 Tax=Nonomuraea rubra TaxID=46180 RepID=A0A7X0NZD1_9ACTN|nr:hypothetical protein [Nonomuraea rubra]